MGVLGVDIVEVVRAIENKERVNRTIDWVGIWMWKIR
jgi:hypothetical protein